MTMDPQALLQLGDEPFVQLTTYRRSGQAVPTVVWVVRDDDALLVTTPAQSGKVKRLRHTSRVQLVPSSRTGDVPAGAAPVQGTAVLDEFGPAHEAAMALFRRKYGWQFRAATFSERLVGAIRRRPADRVLIRITGD